MEGPAADNVGLEQLQQGQGPSLDFFPPEVAMQILAQLDVRSKCRMAQMGHAWRDRVYYKSMWRDVVVVLRMRQSDVSPTMFPTLVERAVRRVKLDSGPHVSAVLLGVPKLESMIVTSYKNEQGLELSSAFRLRQFSNLTELRLIWCEHVTDATLADIARNLVNLVVLVLKCCGLLTDAALGHVADGLSRLRILDLDSCGGVTDAGIRLLTVGARRPVLDKLSVANCKLLTNGALHHLKVGQSSLRILDISNCCFMNEGTSHLAEMTNLEELNMFSCYDFKSLALFHLAGLTSLLRVNMGLCSPMTTNGLIYLAPSLITSLSLELTGSLTDDGIGYVSQMRRLTKLVLRQCRGITDQALTHLAEGVPGLTSLDIRGCPQISRSALMRISFAFHRLQTLKLDQKHVDCHGLDRAAALLSSLDTLNIKGRNCIGVIRRIRNEVPLADRPFDNPRSWLFHNNFNSIVAEFYAAENFNRSLRKRKRDDSADF